MRYIPVTRANMRGAMTALADIVLTGIALCIFALFHHVLPHGTEPAPNLPAPEQKPESSFDTPKEDALFNTYYSEHTFFTENSYHSPDVNVTIRKVKRNETVCFIADVCIRNIEYFRTAFAKGTYGSNLREKTVDMARASNAIIAVSGDYFGIRQNGVVIRNGILYRNNHDYEDVCVLYGDGRMKILGRGGFDAEKEMRRGAYQTWCFGPGLLSGGEPVTEFQSSVKRANPRCAIGYYEPGHYVFVIADGRQPGYSEGLTLCELSQLFYELGCKEAYNLDGGQTAVMVFNGEVFSSPYKGGRSVSDIVYIAGECQKNPNGLF